MPKGKKQRPWKVNVPINSCKEKTGASKNSLEGKRHLKFLIAITPDYKDKKIETEKTKTYNPPFLSLKHPDFKYVIFSTAYSAHIGWN